MKLLPRIEPLEDRIAPALIINPYTVTYQNYETDSSGNQIPGDTVVVKISKPLFTSANAANHILEFTSNPSSTTIATDSYRGNGTPEFLGEINLQGNLAAQGMNISVSVIPQAGIGTNSVNVGNITAGVISNNQAIGNIDLGSVFIQGNLGGITVGDSFGLPGALQSLTVLSMTGSSTVLGSIGKLNIQGNMTGSLDLIGYQFGSIGKLTIGGSLMGAGNDPNADKGTGLIEFSGHIGTATIGNITGMEASNTGEIDGTAGGIGVLHVTGAITGGSAGADSSGNPVQDSGAVFTTGNIGQLIVDGGVSGGGAELSGLVSANSASIGLARVSGGITGNSGQDSGIIAVGKNINTLQVLGSITGSSGIDSGIVTVGGVIGNAAVTGSITGGSAGTAADFTTGAAAVQGLSGVIEAVTIHNLNLGGSLIGGAPDPTNVTSDGTANATADTSGAILANTVGSINITGSIVGNAGPENGVIAALSTSTLGTSYGSITVGGALTGGAGAMSGSILSNGALFGAIKSVHIGGAVTGNSGSQSGEIYATASLGSAYIGGDLAGSSGVSSGEVFSGGPVTSLHIAGNLTGGSGAQSGYVDVTGALGTLFIGKNITGGSADNTGEIIAGGALTTATIQGSLDGNAGGTPISSTSAVEDAGYIQAGHIGTLNITGGVTAGTNTEGNIANSGAIRSATDINSLTIGGAVTGVAGNPVIVTAQQGPGTSTHLRSDLAIGSITVKGATSYLDVLAGYGPQISATSGVAALGTPVDGSAQIGTVTFLSTLSASNVVAGAEPDSNGQFGTSGNTAHLPRAGAFGILSSIAKIVVTGAAAGDSTAGDSFGFVAESLGSIEVNGVVVPTGNLIPGTPSAVSGNLNLLEPLVT